MQFALQLPMMLAVASVDMCIRIKKVAYAVLDVRRLKRQFVHREDNSLCAFQQILVDCDAVGNALLDRETVLVDYLHLFDNG